nr:A/G-specific adenine glycosylase [Vandammella animalimorsus]
MAATELAAIKPAELAAAAQQAQASPASPTPALAPFSERLIAWQRRAGRHGLPWQGTRDPYRVWLSEIMLQQTQVQTVLRYYPRFVQTLPNVQQLAQASEDQVLQLWSGLGYYSRARNLHRAAQQVVAQWGGQFPRDPQQLASLPGIGRSTAHAIAAFCFGARQSILDANVQRVMARWLAFDGDLASTAAVRSLWQQAHQLLPRQDLQRAMPAYTQGLMDLGAMVCTPRKPDCDACPLAADCRARLQQRVLHYPVKTRKLQRRALTWLWLVVRDAQGRVLLQKRPARGASGGIWAQLYCFPSFEEPAQLERFQADCGWAGLALQWQGQFRHVLTHRDLTLRPAVLQLPGAGNALPSLPGSTEQADAPAPWHWVPVAHILAGQWAVPAALLGWLRQGGL